MSKRLVVDIPGYGVVSGVDILEISDVCEDWFSIDIGADKNIIIALTGEYKVVDNVEGLHMCRNQAIKVFELAQEYRAKNIKQNIIDYCVVSGTNQKDGGIDDAVVEKIKEGWKPFGNLSALGHDKYWHQAMVKYGWNVESGKYLPLSFILSFFLNLK